MDDRIVCMTADFFPKKCFAFFPFTQGVLSSQLPETATAILASIHILIDTFHLRVAQTSDATQLYDLLRAYGERTENFNDLEKFSEDRLDTVVQNLSHCLQHRRFITFLLFNKIHPIAFFQIDPYTLTTITESMQQKIFNTWNTYFRQPLELNTLLHLSYEKQYIHLQENFVTPLFQTFCQNNGFTIDPSAWLQFIIGSVQTYRYLAKQLAPSHWIGNISYNLLPEFQKKGLMSCILKKIQPIAQALNAYYLFSDRIALSNIASISLLQRNGFQQAGYFTAYYGPLYKTRNHPNGKFFEPCACFYKKLSPVR